MLVKTFVVIGFICSFIWGILFLNNDIKIKKNIVQLQKGYKYIYNYENEVIGYSDIEKLYSGDTAMQTKGFFESSSLNEFSMHITAIVRQTLLTTAEDKISVLFEIFDFQIKNESNNELIDIFFLKSEIEKPFIVEYSSTGKVEYVKLDSSLSFLSERFLKNITGQFQFVTDGSNSIEWIVNEDNINGQYQSRYKFIKEEEQFDEYQKEKLKYTNVISAEEGQYISLNSIGHIKINKNGVLTESKTSESEITILRNDTLSAGGSKYYIKLIKRENASDSLLNNLKEIYLFNKKFKKSTLNAVHSKNQIKELAYQNTLKEDKFESLSEKLEHPLDSAATDNLVLKFRALAYLFPSECNKMKVKLEMQDYGSKSFYVLFTALSQTETPYSVNALSQVLVKRKYEKNLTEGFLRVFALTQFPTRESEEIVKDIAFDPFQAQSIQFSAQLSLGGMAYHFQKIDQKATLRITKLLYDSLAYKNDTLHSILCLGNTGTYLIYPYLKKLATDTSISSRLRAYAVYSMKLVKSDSVHLFLVNAQNDKDSVVAKFAKEALIYRDLYFYK